VLHPFDDYPVHSSSAPLLDLPTDSPGLYDRYFFNGFDASASVVFGLAFGVYPNRQVMDATFSVLIDGVQHNCRSSRRCDGDRTETRVGAITVEVLEPMLTHRIVVTDHHGVSGDLVIQAVSPVIEEPRFLHRVDGRPLMDSTRMTQFGVWSGWIEVDGTRIELADLGEVSGCRDRSWGLRNGRQGLKVPPTSPQFWWLWAPTMFDDICTHLAMNDDAVGRAWHRSAAVVPRHPSGSNDLAGVLDASRVQRAERLDIEIGWRSGTRWAASMTAVIEPWRAEPVEVVYEPIARFQMSGLGYLHPSWGHGMWRGELDETRDAIVIDEVDPLDPTMLHVQQICRAQTSDRVGLGVLEQLVIGPHEPSGLSDILDGAV
jgi:hypothetical protein